MIHFVILIIFAYLLGSVPFALIIARAHGKDLRSVGSGNIGATNLSRALGRRWAYVCFALDVAKGFAPTVIGALLLTSPPQTTELILVLSVACAAVLGHIFPLYIGFKGGKGVSTCFGVAIGLWPYFTLPATAATVVWIVTVLVSRYISLGSVLAAVCFPAFLTAAIFFNGDWDFSNLWPMPVAAAGIAAVVIWRHRQNIRRLLDGTESKMAKRTTQKQH